MMAIPSDELLLAACAKGDAEAFGKLAGKYGPLLDGYFRRRLPDDGRVEELRQETLAALFALLPSYRERGRFRQLVFSIAYRKLVSALRKEHPRAPLSDGLAAPREDPSRFEVRAAVAALPEAVREALLLTRFDGLSAAEASEILGCSEEAVRARVFRAKALLAKRLNPGRKK